jgi:hypothetical protein
MDSHVGHACKRRAAGVVLGRSSGKELCGGFARAGIGSSGGQDVDRTHVDKSELLLLSLTEKRRSERVPACCRKVEQKRERNSSLKCECGGPGTALQRFDFLVSDKPSHGK